MIATTDYFDDTDPKGPITYIIITTSEGTTTEDFYANNSYSIEPPGTIEILGNFRWWHVFKVKPVNKPIPLLFTYEFKNKVLRIQTKKSIKQFRKQKRRLHIQKG